MQHMSTKVGVIIMVHFKLSHKPRKRHMMIYITCTLSTLQDHEVTESAIRNMIPTAC